jgi:hypothetical protein
MSEIVKILSEATSSKGMIRATTSFLLIVLLYFFAYTFFGLVINENGLISLLIALAVYFLIQTFITNYDVLYDGNPKKNRFVRAFQMKYPSTYIMEKYGIDEIEAKKLWFRKIFNTWENPNHSMYGHRLRCLRRGFICRLVYYVMTVSFGFFCISLFLLIILGILNFKSISFGIGPIDDFISSHNTLKLPLVTTLTYLIVSFFLLFTNYPRKKKPLGCFKRFNEVNEQSIDWLEENFDSLDAIRNYES